MLAEWLRRRTANALPQWSEGSNPSHVEFFFSPFSFLFYLIESKIKLTRLYLHPSSSNKRRALFLFICQKTQAKNNHERIFNFPFSISLFTSFSLPFLIGIKKKKKIKKKNKPYDRKVSLCESGLRQKSKGIKKKFVI